MPNSVLELNVYFLNIQFHEQRNRQLEHLNSLDVSYPKNDAPNFTLSTNTYQTKPSNCLKAIQTFFFNSVDDNMELKPGKKINFELLKLLIE